MHLTVTSSIINPFKKGSIYSSELPRYLPLNTRNPLCIEQAPQYIFHAADEMEAYVSNSIRVVYKSYWCSMHKTGPEIKTKRGCVSVFRRVARAKNQQQQVWHQKAGVVEKVSCASPKT